MRILSPISLSHRCRPTLPRLLVCVRVFFCTGKLTKCVSRFPDRLAYGRTLAQGCSLEKSLTQLETCGEMPKVWNIYMLPGILCAYVCVCVCVCMQGSVFKRTFISSSYIITLPWGRGELSSSPSSFSNLSIPYLLFLIRTKKADTTLPSSEVIMGLTYSQSMALFLPTNGTLQLG